MCTAKWTFISGYTDWIQAAVVGKEIAAMQYSLKSTTIWNFNWIYTSQDTWLLLDFCGPGTIPDIIILLTGKCSCIVGGIYCRALIIKANIISMCAPVFVSLCPRVCVLLLLPKCVLIL